MEISFGSFSSAVERIYESAFNPDIWPMALQEIATELDADSAYLFYVTPNNGKMSFSCGLGFDPHLNNLSISEYRHYFLSDPVAIYGLRHRNEVFSDRRVIPEKDLHACAIYQNIRRHEDMEYVLSVFLEDESQEITNINFMRKSGNIAFGEREEEILKLFCRHIKKASLMNKLMWGSINVQLVQSALLDSLDTALLIVDEDLNVMVGNQPSYQLIDESSLLYLDQNKLKTNNWRDMLRIKEALEYSRDGEINLDEDQVNRNLVRLVSNDKEESLIAVCSAIKIRPYEEKYDQVGLHKSHFTVKLQNQDYFIITLLDPRNKKAYPEETLKSLFDLTASEARLAKYLADDYTLQEAAHILNRTVGTVRVQLQSIFDKTNTRRQSSLVRLLLT